MACAGPILPRSLHLPRASTEGSSAANLNKTGCGCEPDRVGRQTSSFNSEVQATDHSHQGGLARSAGSPRGRTCWRGDTPQSTCPRPAPVQPFESGDGRRRAGCRASLETAERRCRPLRDDDRNDQNATNGQGLWLYQGRWREGLFLPSERGAGRRDQRSPRGRLGRVRGGGRTEGASRRKCAPNVYIGRPLSVDFRAAGRRREIASQRGDELIQVRADVCRIRCRSSPLWQRLPGNRLAPVLGSAASSTPVQVKGGSSTRNERQQNWSESDAQR